MSAEMGAGLLKSNFSKQTFAGELVGEPLSFLAATRSIR